MQGIDSMLTLEMRIQRTQRLLQMFEEDAPLLEMRIAQLTAEHQRSARSHAAELTDLARAELHRLLREQSTSAQAD